MKRLLLALAAFLLASSAAQAQYTFEFGGRTIHIDPDRGTVSIPGIYDNTGRKSKRARSEQDSTRKQTPEETAIDPQPQPQPQPQAQPPADTAAAPAAQSPAQATQAPTPAPAPAAASTSPVPSATTASNAPPETAALPAAPPPPVPTPQVEQNVAPNPAPAPAVAAIPPAPVPTAAPAAAPPDPNSPIGVWLTEEKEGKVRIEQCGGNLCGYSVDAKSNQNGEQVLIDMKPGKDLKWSGRIFDPNTGSSYDSTIALKGTGTLRVQGCAFGGMFCGGQTWTRVN